MWHNQTGSGVKWVIVVTLCAAAAALSVLLYAVTTTTWTFSGAQLAKTSDMTAEEKLRQVLGLEAAQPPQQAEAEAGKININLADAETLDTLPGIGEQLAQRIVEYRSYNGPFSKIEDLMLVSGIGEAKFRELRTQITV